MIKTGKHSRLRFVKNLRRYHAIDYVLQSHSLSEIESRCHARLAVDLLNEYKLSNWVLKVEHQLPSLLDCLSLNKLITNEKTFKKVLVETMCRARKRSYSSSMRTISRYTQGGIRRAFSPFILIHVAGLGLADMKNIVEQYSEAFVNKKDIILLLKNLNECRIFLDHDLLTSRVNVPKKIKSGINDGKKVSHIIESTLKQYQYYKLLNNPTIHRIASE